MTGEGGVSEPKEPNAKRWSVKSNKRRTEKSSIKSHQSLAARNPHYGVLETPEQKETSRESLRQSFLSHWKVPNKSSSILVSLSVLQT